jgi:integrase
MPNIVKRTWKVRGANGRMVRRESYGFSVVVDGELIRRSDKSWTKEDAQRALAEAQLNLAPKPRAGGATFGQLCARYLTHKTRKKTVKQDELSLRHLRGEFGDAPLVSITTSRVADYKARLLALTSERTGRPLTSAAVNRKLALLRHVLRLGHEWEMVEAVPKVRMEREPQGNVRWLSEEELARLMAACADPYLRAVVTVALETGLRAGELRGLTWDRVDLSRGVIRLEVTKSGRRREVPMRQVVYNTLVAMEPKRGRVFPRDWRRAFERAVAEAQLDDFTFHSMRHHFASWFVMRGGSLQTLKEILGHSTLTMTLRYAHLAPEHLRAEMERTAAQETAQSPDRDGATRVKV